MTGFFSMRLVWGSFYMWRFANSIFAVLVSWGLILVPMAVYSPAAQAQAVPLASALWRAGADGLMTALPRATTAGVGAGRITAANDASIIGTAAANDMAFATSSSLSVLGKTIPVSTTQVLTGASLAVGLGALFASGGAAAVLIAGSAALSWAAQQGDIGLSSSGAIYLGGGPSESRPDLCSKAYSVCVSLDARVKSCYDVFKNSPDKDLYCAVHKTLNDDGTYLVEIGTDWRHYLWDVFESRTTSQCKFGALPSGGCRADPAKPVPATPDQITAAAAKAVADLPVSNPGGTPGLVDVARDAYQMGGTFNLVPAVKVSPDTAAPPVPGVTPVANPATGPGLLIEGAPTTSRTVAPDGSVVTKVDTPTSLCTFPGQGVSCQTSTKSETTVQPAPVNGVLPPPTTTTTETTRGADITDPCLSAPTRAGCVLLGDSPDSPVPPPTDVPFEFTPVDFTSAAGCPSPVSFSTRLGSYSLSFQAICDLASGFLRPLFLAVTSFVAIRQFIGGLTV